jgi:hypothetical protein
LPLLSLHFKDFISWGILDNGPLYCITLWVFWIMDHYTVLHFGFSDVKQAYFCNFQFFVCLPPGIIGMRL